ncbi:hypothetical protein R3P38DRAFT_2985761 [Favolaschia claudopus]|uniref:Uncharacterized protein n=1 Tax=Favolaschia claudopus TaxID=2862362 RepID=A0AAW0AUG3_9AGAR
MAASRRRLLTLLLLPFTFSRAALTNVTIDDTDLSYFAWTEDPSMGVSPTLPWAAASVASPCSYCSAQPQGNDGGANIHNQTWHDGADGSAGSLTFQGSAVYIFGIDLTNPANISFTLDKTAAGFHYYAGNERFIYNALFFSTQNLDPNSNHTVAWTLHSTPTNGTAALFDYAILTIDASSTSASPSASQTNPPPSANSKSKSKTGPIVGGVVGGLAAIALVTLALFFFRRRKQKPRDATPTDVHPFVADRAEATPPASASADAVTSPMSEKMLDVSWNNPTLLPTQPTTTTSPSVTSAPSELPSSAPPPSTAPLPAADNMSASGSSPSTRETRAPTTTTDSSARTQALEARLAQLEARMGDYLPPAYGDEEDGGRRD